MTRYLVPSEEMDEAAGDPADRAAQQEVRQEGEQERDEQRLAGIEGSEHAPLIDRVHAEAEQDEAGRRDQPFAQAALALGGRVG